MTIENQEEARLEAWCAAAADSFAKEHALDPVMVRARHFIWRDSGEGDVEISVRRPWWRPWMARFGISSWRYVKTVSGKEPEGLILAS